MNEQRTIRGMQSQLMGVQRFLTNLSGVNLDTEQDVLAVEKLKEVSKYMTSVVRKKTELSLESVEECIVLLEYTNRYFKVDAYLRFFTNMRTDMLEELTTKDLTKMLLSAIERIEMLETEVKTLKAKKRTAKPTGGKK